MGRLNELLTLAHERAESMQLPYAGALTPKEAYELRQLTPASVIVDVRTRAERDWVGRVPDAIEIDWVTYPGMQPNPDFLKTLSHSVTNDNLILFMCRSGGRSHAAAEAAAKLGFSSCYNILEGFEGDKDANQHRNTCNGWRHAGLPWIQS